MCNQQGAIESRKMVTPPASAPKPSALQAGGRADALASTLEATRAATLGRPEVTRSIPVVQSPLPPAAIPEVRAAVEQALAPTEPAASVEAGPAPISYTIPTSEFKPHQRRNLARIMGDRMMVKGLGVISFKQDGGNLIVTLPTGKEALQSLVIAQMQNHLNK